MSRPSGRPGEHGGNVRKIRTEGRYAEFVPEHVKVELKTDKGGRCYYAYANTRGWRT